MTVTESKRTSKTPTGKATKGSVSVEAIQGRLRLRFRFSQKQQVITLGLADTPENRKLAEAKATQIELDIKAGHFDETLNRYQLKSQLPKKVDLNITISELFQEFMDVKAQEVYKLTLQKYNATLNYLNKFHCPDGNNQKCLGDKPAQYLSDNCARLFAEWLKDKNSDRVLKERLGILAACWDWAMKKRIVEYNPWINIQNRIKVAPKQMPKPFTKDEIKAIIQAFETDSHYKHYTNFVKFMFNTGVRTGEAVGLQWKHISDDFSNIWIGEIITKGERRPTKNNKHRTIPLNPQLKELLKSIKPEDANPDDLVFTTRQGNTIDEHNFSARAWSNILSRLGIPYRKPYNCRHTFISHCLESSMNPVVIAQITGHDVRVLYNNYAGVVSRPSLPELF